MQRLCSLSGDEDVTKIVSDGDVTSGTVGANTDLKNMRPRLV